MRSHDVSAYPLLIPSHSPKPLLICFSHLRWSFVWQRPQHLLSLAARDYRVLFIEEPLLAPVHEAHLDISNGPGAVTVVVPVLPESLDPEDLRNERKRLLDDLLEEIGAPVAVSWFYTPMALDSYGHVEADVCVYDCMDELSAFRNAPPGLHRYEAELFERADVVFTGGQSLFEAKRDYHANVHCFPSSIDAAHFRQARKPCGPDPSDQVNIGRPRIGFFGVIDERMDPSLVAEMAELKPNWQLVIIGPYAKIDPADLPRKPNIHWLGAKQYEELPSYLAHWDLGFMPFAINEATRFISPTKTPEFLAAGLPVVSTPVTDVVRTYGGDGYVEIAKNAREMVEKATMLLKRPRATWLERVDQMLAITSWDSTWRKMSQEIEFLRAKRKSLRLPPVQVETIGAGEVSRV